MVLPLPPLGRLIWSYRCHPSKLLYYCEYTVLWAFNSSIFGLFFLKSVGCFLRKVFLAPLKNSVFNFFLIFVSEEWKILLHWAFALFVYFISLLCAKITIFNKYDICFFFGFLDFYLLFNFGARLGFLALAGGLPLGAKIAHLTSKSLF